MHVNAAAGERSKHAPTRKCPCGTVQTTKPMNPHYPSVGRAVISYTDRADATAIAHECMTPSVEAKPLSARALGSTMVRPATAATSSRTARHANTKPSPSGRPGVRSSPSFGPLSGLTVARPSTARMRHLEPQPADMDPQPQPPDMDPQPQPPDMDPQPPSTPQYGARTVRRTRPSTARPQQQRAPGGHTSPDRPSRAADVRPHTTTLQEDTTTRPATARRREHQRVKPEPPLAQTARWLTQEQISTARKNNMIVKDPTKDPKKDRINDSGHEWERQGGRRPSTAGVARPRTAKTIASEGSWVGPF